MPSPSKEEVLQAIRLHAAENGGKPLGKRRFEAVTGIPERAWAGRYWARWNEAVAEAGFETNEWNTANYDDAGLTRVLGDLALDLGHYPVAAERGLHKRTHPEFPDVNVFVNRLGQRQAQVARLVQLGLGEPEYAGLVEICMPLLAPSARHDSIKPGDVVGFVYLLKSGNHHKIGVTRHFGRRSYELDLQLPEKAELVHLLETDDPAGIEHYWHERFASKRANGEWFVLGPKDVAAFKSRGKSM